MKIPCLFAQQKCEYEGQYAPDLRAAITLEVSDAEFDLLFYQPADILRATTAHVENTTPEADQ